jgi:hypothetical protein
MAAQKGRGDENGYLVSRQLTTPSLTKCIGELNESPGHAIVMNTV